MKPSIQRAMAALTAAGCMLLTSPAQAESEAALKQQIQELNARVAQLEKQLQERQEKQEKQMNQAPEGTGPVYSDFSEQDLRNQPFRSRSFSWDPFAEMDSMQRAMNRLFEESLNRGHGLGFSDMFNPRVDIKEAPNQYTITMDIPGMDKNKIEVKVEGRQLLVSGERNSETQEQSPGKIYRQERSFGHFMRAIPLPEDASNEKVDASYENGVLTVKVPRNAKATKSKTQKIPVK